MQMMNNHSVILAYLQKEESNAFALGHFLQEKGIEYDGCIPISGINDIARLGRISDSIDLIIFFYPNSIGCSRLLIYKKKFQKSARLRNKIVIEACFLDSLTPQENYERIFDEIVKIFNILDQSVKYLSGFGDWVYQHNSFNCMRGKSKSRQTPEPCSGKTTESTSRSAGLFNHTNHPSRDSHSSYLGGFGTLFGICGKSATPSVTRSCWLKVGFFAADDTTQKGSSYARNRTDRTKGSSSCSPSETETAYAAEEMHYDSDAKTSSIKLYSSVFAPREIEAGSHLLIQVFFHTKEDSTKAQEIAKESQSEAIRMDYTALSCEVKKGDTIEALLNISGEKLLSSQKKAIPILSGSELSKCRFMFMVPEDISAKDLACELFLTVNGMPVGEMLFVTKIVKDTVPVPEILPSDLYAKQFNRVFISYAHQDLAHVKPLASTCEKLGLKVFFDRHSLRGGDIFEEKIINSIKNADLFILCWSEHAAQSDYVKKERNYALSLAYPQITPRENAHLTIYPISMEPKAPLPDDMKEIYNFEET